MLTFDIRDNGAQLLRQVDKIRKERIPRALKEAANESGRYIHGALRSEMREVFDRPTPWALGGLRFKLATEAKPLVRIWIEETPGKGIPAARFLAAEIEGGPRKLKRFERALIAAGKMPPGSRAVPGRQAPLDAYGNVPGPFIVRMLSDLRAFGESGYRANRRGKRTGARKTNYFFIPRPGDGKPPGVYWHMPNGLLGVVFHFVSSATYRKRYDFYGVASRAYARKSIQFLAEALLRQARS